MFLVVQCIACSFLELLNVFDVFIPQLLRYPNPSDPLNGEAASLLMKDAESYNTKVRGETGEVLLPLKTARLRISCSLLMLSQNTFARTRRSTLIWDWTMKTATSVT